MHGISIVKADITTLSVDAIVNAANSSLLGGSGVDGAIHKAAGPDLANECRRLGGCKTGEVKVSAGYNLEARFILHTVGPVWRSGDHGEAAKLRSCYSRSMEIANELGVRSIAFPAISCGRYRFPIDRAARIAISTVAEMQSGTSIESVTFAVIDPNVFDAYRAVFESLASES